MRVLTFSSLYPNRIEPRHGIFVKNRMDYFDRIAGNSRMVIAPLQYFPLLGLSKNSKFHRYNQVAKQEVHGDITVYHPRYITIPGTNLIDAAGAMAAAADRVLRTLPPAEKAFDLIDGHYLYPDGVAAGKLARKYNTPLILTARGSDVNFWLEQPSCRQAILQVIDDAAKVVCVSHDLMQRLIRHGVSKNKLTVIINGVDRSIFTPGDRHQNRRGYLLSVGNLVPLKGHEFILRSLKKCPEDTLVIIGSGPLENHLKAVASQLNIADRVTFCAPVPQKQLAGYYAGARATILMSSSEGMPNVILESLACGTPVIATRVGGIAEVVTKDNGILLDGRSAEDLTYAL
ncbi:MAG: glycosyltransferase family 4 protein, partial [Alphaproteobacteria bacterium]|nr:glycosyltransferase family 4 protein [Alphaproteobacteria bacterium]